MRAIPFYRIINHCCDHVNIDGAKFPLAMFIQLTHSKCYGIGHRGIVVFMYSKPVIFPYDESALIFCDLKFHVGCYLWECSVALML